MLRLYCMVKRWRTNKAAAVAALHNHAPAHMMSMKPEMMSGSMSTRIALSPATMKCSAACATDTDALVGNEPSMDCRNTVPHMATPIAVPKLRAIVNVPDASPDFAVGTELTTAKDVDAITSPMPMPHITNAGKKPST